MLAFEEEVLRYQKQVMHPDWEERKKKEKDKEEKETDNEEKKKCDKIRPFYYQEIRNPYQMHSFSKMVCVSADKASGQC